MQILEPEENFTNFQSHHAEMCGIRLYTLEILTHENAPYGAHERPEKHNATLM